MDEQVEHLVHSTWAKYQRLDDSRRLLIAIAGIPGSGKTTLAQAVAAGLNLKYHEEHRSKNPLSPKTDSDHPDPSQPDIAVTVGLDGYHLTRKQLSEMSNSEEAIFRRGAAFTFDAQGYLKLVQELRKPLEATTPTIYAPSFDHAVKDPVPDDIAIPSTAHVVLLEGNYVALDAAPWSDAAELMDLIWFVDVSYDTATLRLVKRHVASGICPDAEQALQRVRNSDMRNGRDIVNGKVQGISETIRSVEDKEWKSEEARAAEGMHERGEIRGAEGLLAREGRRDSIAEMAASGAGL